MVVQQAPITRGPVKWHHPPPIIILPRVGEGSGTASNPPCELNKCRWDSFFVPCYCPGSASPSCLETAADPAAAAGWHGGLFVFGGMTSSSRNCAADCQYEKGRDGAECDHEMKQLVGCRHSQALKTGVSVWCGCVDGAPTEYVYV